MKLRSLRRPRRLSGLRLLALTSAWTVASCHAIDTTRIAPPKGTLGDDMFGVFCDRVGASSFTEDLTGASYHAVCHYDADGKYENEVDESELPPPMGAKGKHARALSIAKIAAMARHRGDLVRAVNSIFPDNEIDDVTSKGGKKIRFHDALLDFTQTLVPLYETNPFDAKGDPLFPTTTRALGRLFDALAQSEPARKALSQIGSRNGYRPSDVALGVMRPALTYPKLRPLAKAALEVIGPDGAAVPELQQLFAVLKQELLSSKPVVAPLPSLVVDAATMQPNRPRSNIEVAAAILLSQHEGFAEGQNPSPTYIAARDRRGFVLTPLSAPFVDQDGDGFADVDAFGRFIDASGAALAVDPPFAIPGVTGPDVDPFNRPASAVPLYTYLDTSRSAVGAIARHLVPLLDATEASDGAAETWKSEHETLMYTLAGAYTLYGPRAEATYDYANETVNAGGVTCDTCLPYLRFKGEESPLPALLHATGQVLADEDSDAILESLGDLVDNHEKTVARLLGAALHIREIALAHDAKAAQGAETFASMPYATPIWDEMAKVVNDITKHPGLTKRLVKALASDTIVSEQGSSAHMGETVASFLQNRDEIGYNRYQLPTLGNPDPVNGPRINVTDGFPSTEDPHNPVDRTKALTGKNRSCLQRSLQIIHDANGGPACNKAGATIPLTGFISWPLVGSYKQCELFQFDNLATFYLDSALAPNHPKRATLKIKDGTLTGIMNFLGIFVDPNALFVTLSGITGLTLKPEPSALNVLVFFGAAQSMYPSMPDHDALNAGGTIDDFVSSTIEPVSIASCPPDAMGAPTCASVQGTLRVAGPNTIFLWERLGFYNYLQPLVNAFADTACTPPKPASCDLTDMSGEALFVEVIEVLNRHWPGKEHGNECEKIGNAKSNGKYCSEAGVNTYEPILVESFRADIVPALHEFSVVADELSKITVKRGKHAGETWTGADVLSKLMEIMFSTDYAAKVGMLDRKGNKATTWVDGTTQSQVTGFTLFADALHGLDVRWDTACDGLAGDAQASCKVDVEARRGQWKASRSQLVDEFLAVEGSGAAATFRNRATPRALSALIRVIREQLNANCPERESGVPCAWAKRDLAEKLSTTLSGPLFAAIMDVQEKLRENEPARRALERMLTDILTSDNFAGTLSSFADLLQVLSDDGDLSPIFNAIAVATSPEDDAGGPGAADMTLKVLKALTGDEYDRHHVLDRVLPALVTPMKGGVSPIEVFMDTVADVNRIDAESPSPLEAEDYEAIMTTVNDFLTSKTRGLEQFYTIVQNRPRP